MTREALSWNALGRMHKSLSTHVANGDMPGVVTAVARGDEAHLDAIGAMAPGGAPIRRDTIFRISSMTKPVAGAATMILVETGRSSSTNPWKTRILSARSVREMTANHLTRDQGGSELVPGYWNNHGWGFCVSVLTAPDDLTTRPGRYGWEGGMGTTWFNDPNEDLTAILMTPRMVNGPDPPPHFRAFWKAAYEAVRD